MERSSENIGSLVFSVRIPSRTFWCVQWWTSRCVWWKIAQISMLQCHQIGRVHCSCCYARVIWRVNWYSCANPGTALDEIEICWWLLLVQSIFLRRFRIKLLRAFFLATISGVYIPSIKKNINLKKQIHYDCANLWQVSGDDVAPWGWCEPRG